MTNVAIVLSSLRAEGGPSLAADLAAEWLADGHNVVVLTLSACDMTMAPRFKALGVPVEVLGVDSIGPGHWPTIAFAVAGAARRHRIDALVSIPNGVHGAIFAGAAMAGVHQRVVHVGNYPWHWQHGFWKYRLTMIVSALLTPELVCVTEHVRKGVVSYFGHVSRRLHVIPNGIDLSAFPFRGQRTFQGKRLAVLMVARLDAGKDHDTLIDAIAILRGRGIDATLDIVGDGALRANLESKVAQSGLSIAVRFLGSRRDVPDLLLTADVFAFSVGAEEGLGIALVEAMAVGVPVVATDVGACREVLAGGEVGLLVPQNSPEAFADAILSAAQQAPVGLARARVESTYSRRAMAIRYGRLCGLS